jgi:copper chaperone
LERARESAQGLGRRKEATNMKSEELKIEGMTCNHCVMSVKKELSKLAGVNVEDVQIGKARVEYDETRGGAQDFARAIDEAGFKLLS